MKKNLQFLSLLCLFIVTGQLAEAQTIFINEIHYDNAGTDVNEAVEIAGPAGSDLTGWSLVLYNGNNGASYDTRSLSGLIADEGEGYGFSVINYPSNGIQNGAPDGLALVNAEGSVVQFLSYEGVFTAVGGPADGLSSTNIGVSENGSTPEGFSLQLTGAGSVYTDFSWASEAPNTFGAVNNGQNFGTEDGGDGTEPEPIPEPATTLVFINEIHYDNTGADEGEGVELAGLAGTNLNGWQLVPYNGSNGAAYSTLSLSGTIPDQQAGFGTIFFPIEGLQNGAPDGIALVDAAGEVIQFISYEGTFTASNGPAIGLSSTDIGVEEGSSTPIGFSLQLTGAGSAYEDFSWAPEAAASYNAANNSQVFLPLQEIVFINEIHYDNVGTDVDEAIEIAGRAGTDLSGWSLVLYNGSNGTAYNTQALSGTIADQNNGFGFVTITYPVNGIQNGSPDAVALVNAEGEVVQFLSYEGSFTATGGPADGHNSTDVGVEETSSTPVGYSLQLTGAGFVYEDFSWSGPATSTFGDINVGQDFGGGTTEPDPDPEPQQVSIAAAKALPIGTPVIVSGTLTAANELGGPAYLQDNTGGIPVFDYQLHGPDAFNIGDSVQLSASVGVYNQMVQLVEVSSIESFGPASNPVAPLEVNIADITPALEGQLISIANATFTDTRGLLFPESNYIITDGTGSLELRIDGDVESLAGMEFPEEAVTITGVLGSFRGTLQILPRFSEDLPGATPFIPEGSDIPLSSTLDVMSWNMEFFGSTIANFGPENVQLQLENAARLMDSVRADVIAVQEISDENMLQQLADMLGYEKVCSDRFSYSFNGPDPSFPEQRICFLYNPEVITLVNERVLFEAMYDSARVGYSTALDTYPTGSGSSFWSSGRLPYMITVDAVVEGVTERIQLVNIHAKSGSSSADLSRRRFDVQALKDSLDQYYPDANIIFLGDYNDDVDESIGGGESTYSVFVEAENFRTVTASLSETGLRSFIAYDNMIDHISISDELYDNYLGGSEGLVIPFSYIRSYANTTSDHLPVLTRFELAEPLVVEAGGGQLVYLGYAPQACATLTAAEVTGGHPGYTYSWSTGENGASIEVCPAETTVYTLTVTDARGVTSTDSVQVCVADVRCGNNNNAKVQMYHNPSGKAGKGKVLCISENAVPAQLARGAVLGNGEAVSCNESSVQAKEAEVQAPAFTFKAYPNPVAKNLSIEFDEQENGELEVVFYNIMGEEVYKKVHHMQDGRLEFDIRRIRLNQGINYLKVSSRYSSRTIRIIRN